MSNIKINGKAIIIPHKGVNANFINRHINDIESLLDTTIDRYSVLSKTLKIYLNSRISEETAVLIKEHLA